MKKHQKYLKVESQDNGIPNFEVDSIEKVEPALFSDDEGVSSVNSKETEAETPKMFESEFQEEDFEIPAFLRRQKN